LHGTPTKRQVTKRQVSKRQVSKRLVSKRPVSKRQVYKTSGFKTSRFKTLAATEPADFHQSQVQNINGCFFSKRDVLKT
jgi:hypothetical protein